jgi:hypothetical protein
MRKTVLFLFATLSTMALKASPLGTETPIRSYGTPTTVSISTSAWTLVPASQSLSGQTGILVSLPASASAVMVGHLASCTSTSVATTVRPLEIAKGGFVLVPVADNVCLYLLSLHTAAESAHVQEIKQ